MCLTTDPFTLWLVSLLIRVWEVRGYVEFMPYSRGRPHRCRPLRRTGCSIYVLARDSLLIFFGELEVEPLNVTASFEARLLLRWHCRHPKDQHVAVAGQTETTHDLATVEAQRV